MQKFSKFRFSKYAYIVLRQTGNEHGFPRRAWAKHRVGGAETHAD
jgi:hypothetical protein